MSKEDARRQGIEDAMNGKNNPSGTDVFDKIVSIGTFGLGDFSRNEEEKEAYKQGHNEGTLAKISSGKP